MKPRHALWKLINLSVLIPFFCIMLVLASVSSRSKAEELTQDEYRALLSEGLTQVREKIPVSTNSLEFAVNLSLAHEAWIEYMPEDVLIKAVDAIAETGATRIDINMGPFPWVDSDESVIRKYDAVVARIRQAGIKLNINPQFSRIKGHDYRSIEEWDAVATQFYQAIALRYKPETFVVVHEPTTMEARMGFKASPAEWGDFAAHMARVVKQASPSSRIGAGGLNTEQRHFEVFARIQGVDVLTLNIYNLKGLRTFNAMVNTAKLAGKPVYIEETWRPPYFTPHFGQSLDTISMQHVGNSEFERLDEEWFITMTQYARALDLEGITLFWVPTFFTYSDKNWDVSSRTYNTEVIEAIRQGKRTEMYKTVQRIIHGHE